MCFLFRFVDHGSHTSDTIFIAWFAREFQRNTIFLVGCNTFSVYCLAAINISLRLSMLFVMKFLDCKKWNWEINVIEWILSSMWIDIFHPNQSQEIGVKGEMLWWIKWNQDLSRNWASLWLKLKLYEKIVDTLQQSHLNLIWLSIKIVQVWYDNCV